RVSINDTSSESRGRRSVRRKGAEDRPRGIQEGLHYGTGERLAETHHKKAALGIRSEHTLAAPVPYISRLRFHGGRPTSLTALDIFMTCVSHLVQPPKQRSMDKLTEFVSKSFDGNKGESVHVVAAVAITSSDARETGAVMVNSRVDSVNSSQNSPDEPQDLSRSGKRRIVVSFVV
uniref:Uncharacterized protein n=1 Tax=Strigamia maritima TaxID=126957 RepID=T1J455_STRMM